MVDYIKTDATGNWSNYIPARLGQRLTALNAQGEAVEAVVVSREVLETAIGLDEDEAWGAIHELRAMMAAANG